MRAARWLGVSALALSMTSAVSAIQSAAAEELKAGKKTFDQTCAECHGKKGHGDGEKAERMGWRPRDLSLGSFKCRCTPSGTLPTDEDLLRSMRTGLPGSPMPGQDDLDEPAARALLAYVKSLSARFSEERAGSCIDVPAPVPLTPELVEEGEQIYRLMGCASCHGMRGRADGPSAKTLVDDWGERVKVHNFVLMKKFKCGGEPSDLYRTLHTGLDGAPMPSYSAAFLFASDSVADLAPLRAAVGDEAALRVETYLREQPGSDDLDELDESARGDLVERRTWSLVYYLQSLVSPAAR